MMTQQTASAIGLSVVAAGLLYIAAMVVEELEGYGEGVYRCPCCNCVSFARTRVADGTRFHVFYRGGHYGLLLRCRDRPDHGWVRMDDPPSAARVVRSLPWRVADWIAVRFRPERNFKTEARKRMEAGR